jgi:hypothetical protein
MRNLDRESFFETVKEKLVELGEVFIEFNVTNFEFYDAENDEIEDEEVKRLVEILRDANDVVERNV